MERFIRGHQSQENRNTGDGLSSTHSPLLPTVRYLRSTRRPTRAREGRNCNDDMPPIHTFNCNGDFAAMGLVDVLVRGVQLSHEKAYQPNQVV